MDLTPQCPALTLAWRLVVLLRTLHRQVWTNTGRVDWVARPRVVVVAPPLCWREATQAILAGLVQPALAAVALVSVGQGAPVRPAEVALAAALAVPATPVTPAPNPKAVAI